MKSFQREQKTSSCKQCTSPYMDIGAIGYLLIWYSLGSHGHVLLITIVTVVGGSNGHLVVGMVT